MSNYNKITALYSRLSVGDEDRDGGESNSIQNQKILAFRCLVWVSGSGGGGAGRVVWGYGYHVVVHRRPATA